jgi:hypothetical protein
MLFERRSVALPGRRAMLGLDGIMRVLGQGSILACAFLSVWTALSCGRIDAAVSTSSVGGLVLAEPAEHLSSIGRANRQEARGETVTEDDSGQGLASVDVKVSSGVIPLDSIAPPDRPPKGSNGRKGAKVVSKALGSTGRGYDERTDASVAQPRVVAADYSCTRPNRFHATLGRE